MSPLSDGRPLFRPEAVEAHARGRFARKPLDLTEHAVRWMFRGLIVAVALAVLAGFTVHADLTTKGAGRVDDGSGNTATFFLPAGALRRLHAGQRGWVHLRDATVYGTVERIGTPQAGDDGVFVPVTVRLDEAEVARSSGVAYVRLGHPTLVALLLGRHSG